MKLFKFFLLLSILSLTLQANQSSSYILITKTSKESNLKNIKNSLDKIRVKMYVQKADSFYFVYSKKYTNQQKAENELQNIQVKFPYAKIVLQEKDYEEKFFLSLSIGAVDLSGSTNNQTAATIDNRGLSYNLEAGYFYTKEIFITTAFLSSSTDDININNLYMSLNYKFDINQNIDLYMGLLGGVSSLKLTNYAQSSASSSLLYGLQVGAKYKIYKNFSLFSQFQSIFLTHRINFTTDEKIDFNMLNALQAGVLYSF